MIEAVDCCTAIQAFVVVPPGIDACKPLPWNRVRHRQIYRERYPEIGVQEPQYC